MERNTKDLQTILDYFEEREPFAKTTTELQSLSLGVIADGSVNADSAASIGSAIIASMEGIQEKRLSCKDGFS